MTAAEIIADIDALPYQPPTGGPLYWRDEQSGVLRTAVLAYLMPRATEPTADQIAILAAYCRHWVKAPCWKANPYSDVGDLKKLDELTEATRQITTRLELSKWLHRALDLCIDPL